MPPFADAIWAAAEPGDPWKWWAFHNLTVPRLKQSAPTFAVALLGMAAAVAARRRHPEVARRVFAGAAGFGLAAACLTFQSWVRAILDPAGPGTAAPEPRPLLEWLVTRGAPTALNLAGVWLVASAAVHGRRRTYGDA